MSHRKKLWLRAAVPATVLALALTACGGDDDASDGAGAQETGQSQDQDQDQDAQEDAPAEDEASEEPSSGSFALGETAGPAPYEYSDATAQLEITVQKLEQGDIADVEAAGVFDAEDIAGRTPYYLYVDYQHVGGEELKYGRPGSELRTTLSDGSYVPSVIMIGDLGIPGGCPASEEPDTLAEGEGFTDCDMFLIPEGAELGETVWTGADDSEFTWKLN
ncbi:hypothetical protein HUT13_10975 [Streptomyces harbinensis]|uniref:hypothetical protein n=1 Tax=Streptomyces harbinensis TaxID=1176198 RepID=UPI0015909219|nr:hypothetical protein [Streptomyces harbinensis]QKV69246.1 hypothetical protein HUT13_10975 [Streptomyces harbinensis]